MSLTGKLTAHLTPFQLRTDRALGALLDERGARVVERTIEGLSEPYVRIVVDDFTVWIYVDGASIIGHHIDRVFEKWDYASLDALEVAVLECVDGILDTPA